MGNLSIAAALALVMVPAVAAQTTAVPSTDTLLDRLAEYVLVYEQELSALVADETYDQRTWITASTVDAGRTTGRRKLESTVWLMRLPGGAAWLGLREVQRVDGRVVAHGEALQSLLATTAIETPRRASELAAASSQYNLGNPRTVSMPTLVLEFLHPRNRERFVFRSVGGETVRGAQTRRIEFEEKGVPTIIRAKDDSGWAIARGVVWVETNTGAIWRAHVYYRPFISALPDWRAPEAGVEVDFVRNATLGLLVPHEMRETFGAPMGQGEGIARYSNYRRFTTSARIVPQP